MFYIGPLQILQRWTAIWFPYFFCILSGARGMMGDFNLPTVNWNHGPPVSSSSHDNIFLDCFISLGMTQYIVHTTFIPSGRILDLVLTSDPEIISHISPLPPFRLRPLPYNFFMHFRWPQLDYSEPKTPRFDCFRGNYQGISRSLTGTLNLWTAIWSIPIPFSNLLFWPLFINMFPLNPRLGSKYLGIKASHNN